MNRIQLRILPNKFALMEFGMKILLSRLAIILAVFVVISSPSREVLAQYSQSEVEFDIYKAGFIVGVSGGSGTLTFKGKKYPLQIGGISLGATIGASKAQLIGTAENLTTPADINGTYTSTEAGLAIAGGKKTAQLKNSKGVILKVKGKQIGLEFALDLSGLQISLK